MVWVFGLLRFFVYHNLTVLSGNDKSLSISNDCLDIKSFTWAFGKEHFVISSAFKKHNFSLIRAHQKSAIWKPSMASVVVADMGLLLCDLSMVRVQVVVFLHFVELESVVSSHKDVRVVQVMERALVHVHISLNSDLLVGKAFGLVPHPKNNLPVRFSSLKQNVKRPIVNLNLNLQLMASMEEGNNGGYR